MCRHACYLGSPVSLDEFLFQPDHSLLIQSYKPREMLEAEVNVDGFGLGWYPGDGTLKSYKSAAPIWADCNLRGLAPLLHSGLWVGNVRSATVPETITRRDTPPYCVGDLVFSHNGFIREFAEKVRPLIRKFLLPEIEAGIQGNTDSEYLFAVLRQLLPQHGGDVAGSISSLFDKLRLWGGDSCGLFNIIVSNGQDVVATRHGFGGQCPSLYLGGGALGMGDSWVISSEPMSENGDWNAVPEHHIVSIKIGDAPIISAL